MHIELKIDNVYDDGTITTHVAVEIDEPPEDEDTDEWEDWEDENIMAHTGTGRPEGDAGYFVEVTACDDPSLVGRKFEFGI